MNFSIGYTHKFSLPHELRGKILGELLSVATENYKY